MAVPKVLTGATLAAGLRSDFMDAWKQDYDGVLKNLGDVMSLGIASDKRIELYAARRTMPYPERWDYGDPIPEEGTDSKAWNVTNYRYAKRVPWLRDDRMDNQVGDLRGDAQNLGSHFASLPSKFLIEVMTASPSLLPAIPNAPDEVALYNTVDETGAARFGVTARPGVCPCHLGRRHGGSDLQRTGGSDRTGGFHRRCPRRCWRDQR